MSSELDLKQNTLNVVRKLPYSFRQIILGCAYLSVPRRRSSIVPLLRTTVGDLLRRGPRALPDPSDALKSPDGLCGLTGKIGADDLLKGYANGMFVLNHFGPLKWWAPEYRMTLFFDKSKIEKSVRRLLRSDRLVVTFDQAFDDVMEACAAPGTRTTPLTWITPTIKQLFSAAHANGDAHSVEVWAGEKLVGGVYGLAVGKVFFTESQFYRSRDASKLAFAMLNRHLQAWGFAMNDGKHPTQYLADCGMSAVTRSEFTQITRKYATMPGPVGRWSVDQSLMDDSWDPVAAAGLKPKDLLPGGSHCPWSLEELLTTKRGPTW